MKLMIILAAVMLLALHCHAADCVQYGKTVTIRGTIKRVTFPGPPNYESVARGDAPEVYWVLVLRRPICVDGGDQLDPKESGIRRIQLALALGYYSKYRRFVNKNVIAQGILWHANTGHHHTKVKLDMVELKSEK